MADTSADFLWNCRPVVDCRLSRSVDLRKTDGARVHCCQQAVSVWRSSAAKWSRYQRPSGRLQSPFGGQTRPEVGPHCPVISRPWPGTRPPTAWVALPRATSMPESEVCGSQQIPIRYRSAIPRTDPLPYSVRTVSSRKWYNVPNIDYQSMRRSKSWILYRPMLNRQHIRGWRDCEIIN